MFKKAFIALSLATLLLMPLAPIQAADARSTRYGLDEAARNTDLKPLNGTPSNTLAIEIGNIVGTLLSFLGVIFLILMIAGGLIWMTAAGNDAKVKTARGLIIAAIIGLVIVVSAYAITTFIADNVLAK